MKIIETSFDKYKQIVMADAVFNKTEFNNLNSSKVDEVHYLIFKDSKNRFGLTIGEYNGEWLCPFSAPFGTFVNVKNKWNIYQLDDAIKAFDDYMKIRKCNVKFVLPPEFYNPSIVCVMENSLYNIGYYIKFVDVNFYLDLRKVFSDNYKANLPNNGRKNLRIALLGKLSLRHCETEEEKEKAYGIIQTNRLNRGYPLNMSLEQVMTTIGLVGHDMFIVELETQQIAAALVYHVTGRIGQVVYWGDIPGYSEYKPINFLSYQLIQYYGERGFEYLDIGISTDHGIINYGLSDFKISIGCDMSTKLTFTKDYSKLENTKKCNSIVAKGTIVHNRSYLKNIAVK